MKEFYTVCVNDVETLCNKRGLIYGLYDYKTHTFIQLQNHLSHSQKLEFEQWRISKQTLLI